MTKPTVSIIMAAYNRAEVMRYAISSVVQSGFGDWELLVVGDGCTDHSEQVAVSFGDPRITFENLAKNSGGQSAPNNHAVPQARGDYLFFLNQDDMYFADHIARSIAFIEQTGADLIWSPVILLRRSGVAAGPPDPDRDIIDVGGAVDAGGFDSRVFVITSSWVVRRSAYDRVGPWLDADETRLLPSQEWLFRAWRSGIKMVYHPYFSVLCILAGIQRFAYLETASPAHARAWSWVENQPSPGADLLSCLSIHLASRLYRQPGRPTFGDRLQRAAQRVGIHPLAVQGWLAGQRKGQRIREHRDFTDAAPELALGETLRLGENGATPYLGSGWHNADQHGRWTSADPALLCFALREEDRGKEGLAIELHGKPLLPEQAVRFRINGGPAVTHRFDEFEAIRLPLKDGTAIVQLHISVPTQSPKAVHGASDDRQLGFMLTRLSLVSKHEPLAR